MIIFSVQRNFEGNLYSTYVVKVFLEGITILGRRDWTITKVRETPLKVKCPLTDTPQAYELTRRLGTDIMYQALHRYIGLIVLCVFPSINDITDTYSNSIRLFIMKINSLKFCDFD